MPKSIGGCSLPLLGATTHRLGGPSSAHSSCKSESLFLFELSGQRRCSSFTLYCQHTVAGGLLAPNPVPAPSIALPAWQAFGCELSDEEISNMFRAADKDGSNSVSGDELAEMLSSYHEAGDFYKLIKRCPIDGRQGGLARPAWFSGRAALWDLVVFWKSHLHGWNCYCGVSVATVEYCYRTSEFGL